MIDQDRHVDLVAAVAEPAHKRAVHGARDDKGHVANVQSHMGRLDAIRNELNLVTRQVKVGGCWVGKALELCDALREQRLGDVGDLVQIVAQDFQFDAVPAADPAEDRCLKENRKGALHQPGGALHHRNQGRDLIGRRTATTHKADAPVSHVEKVLDRRRVNLYHAVLSVRPSADGHHQWRKMRRRLRARLRLPILLHPIRLARLAVHDGRTHRSELIQRVARRREDHPEHQILVALRQIVGRRHQQPRSDERSGRQTHHQTYPRAHRTIDPPHQAGDESRHLTSFLPVVPMAFPNVQHFVGQRRDDQDRHQQRQPHSGTDGDGDVAEQLSRFLLDKHHRDKHRHGGQGTGQHGAPHLGGPFRGRLEQRRPQLAMAEDVLQHDDGVIHHHPDGKRQPGEHHHVQIPSQQRDHQEGPDDGDGNRRSHHKRGGAAPQEDQQHDDGQNAAVHHVALDQIDRRMDVNRLVVHLGQAASLRFQHIPVEFRDPLPEFFHHLNHVGAGLAPHRHSQHVVAQRGDEGSLFLVALDHGGHVADKDRPTLVIPDHRVLHLFDMLVLTHRTVGVIAFPLGNGARGDTQVLAPDGPLQVLKGQTPRRQSLRVHQDMQFAFTSPINVQRCDPRYAFQERLDVVIHIVIQGRGLLVRPPLENQPGDGGLVRRFGGLNDRLLHLFGISAHLAHLLRHVAQGVVLVHPHEELQSDSRFVFSGGGGHLPQVGHALELLLLTLDDLALDLLHAGPGPVRGHRHDRLIHVGRKLNGNPKDAQDPEQHEKDYPDGDLYGVLNGKANNGHL